MIDLINIFLFCVDGRHLCAKENSTQIRYYQPGKSCYIEGIFYESCPKLNYYEKSTRQKRT